MLQVTLYTPLKLHGRTTELPSSDFNRLVIRFTRQTLQLNSLEDFKRQVLLIESEEWSRGFRTLMSALHI
jgi:hypothetical protein